MCFHIAIPNKTNLLKVLPAEVQIQDYTPHFHTTGFDHPDLPVWAMDNLTHIKPMKWGLVPHWTNSVAEAREYENKSLNAKAETLFTAPLFRNYAPHNRCLIFVNGFYEWRQDGKNKIPYFIYRPDRAPFALGGVYAIWENKDWWRNAGCSIITRASDTLLSEINNTKYRMPLVLPQSKWGQWLDPALNPLEVEELLKPYESELRAHTISNLISSRTENSDVPEVQQKVILPPDTFF